MKIYGLTGGIGSGKSRVAARFIELGIPAIDMDKLGHAVIAPQGPAVKDVLKAFGTDILTDGSIDRQALGKIVFADKDALATLNNIVHPLIHQELQKKCAKLKDEGHPIIIVEAALLAEGTQFEPWLDGLILVLCKEEIRAQRLADSGRMTKAEAAKRIAAQVPPESKTDRATYIIQNDRTEEELMKQVDEIQREL